MLCHTGVRFIIDIADKLLKHGVMNFAQLIVGRGCLCYTLQMILCRIAEKKAMDI
jgi:hypothetical protein